MLRLDGLRAMAIAAVLLHHHLFLPHGWLGVELFFVLSGYLITKGLRRSREAERFWATFYIKRATRIVPALLILLLFAVSRPGVPLRSLAAYVFFLGNFIAGTHLHNQVLGVLWSLAVEEHFYILFPFAVRFLSKKHLVTLLVGTIVLEPILRLVATPHFHSYEPIYFWTPFRLDGLASGALLAVGLETTRTTDAVRRLSGPLTLVCGGLFLALSEKLPRFNRLLNSRLFNGFGYSLAVVACTALVAYILLHENSYASKVLSWKPWTVLGVISYGVYLFHIPVLFAFMHRTGRSPQALSILTIAVTIGISWASFRWFENPITKWGHAKALALRSG